MSDLPLFANLNIYSEHIWVFYIELLFVIIIGLALGSFSSALIYRIPKGLPWIIGKTKDLEGKDINGARSYCPHCGTDLKFLDLIPLLSWMFNKGRCRHCANPISKIYPIIELVSLLLCFLSYVLLGFSAELFFILALTPFLLALLVIDLEKMILPNALVFIVGAIGFFYMIYTSFFVTSLSQKLYLVDHVIGFFLYGGVSWFLGWFMSKLLKKDALGFGDVKFFAAAGIWLGVSSLSVFCFFAGIFGVIMALIWQVFFKKRTFPFGPALITSLYLLILFEGSLLH